MTPRQQRIESFLWGFSAGLAAAIVLSLVFGPVLR